MNSKQEEEKHTDANCALKELMVDVAGPADPNKLRHLLSTHLHRPGIEFSRGANARDSPALAAQSAARLEWRAPAATPQNSVTPTSAGSIRPRMLQPLGLHKRASLTIVKPGGAGGPAPLKPVCSHGPLATQARQLPPPSRGLPSFSAGPQVQPRSLSRTSPLQPHRASKACRDPKGSSSSLEEPDQGMLKDPGSAKILIPLSRSCLPKPKIP